MRKIELLILALMLPLASSSQFWNLQDSSFEACYAPDSCVYWQSIAGYPRNIAPSHLNPDYQAPSNIYGYETAAHGSRYMKVVMESSNNYREYIGTYIGTPFAAGNRLAVSFSVSRAENCQWACNNIGISFELGSWIVSGPFPSNGTDSIRIPQVVYQENGWYTYTDTFTTPSDVDRIVIGNARSRAETTIDTVSDCGPEAAIYYIDDVRIEILPAMVGIQEPEKPNLEYHHSTNLLGQPVPRETKGIRVDWYKSGETWEYRKVMDSATHQ